jgi:hypothetical protein
MNKRPALVCLVLLIYSLLSASKALVWRYAKEMR